jgi:hypothetical protein
MSFQSFLLDRDNKVLAIGNLIENMPGHYATSRTWAEQVQPVYDA